MTDAELPERATFEEEWRSVVGYEDFYLVSNRGRVQNRKRLGRFISPTVTKRGYRRVQLHNRGRSKTFAVHRLVLEAFVGPCPEGMETCHRDCNPANNNLSNLRWDTHPENIKDSVRLGRRAGAPRRKRRIRATYVHGPRQKPIKTHCKRKHPQTVWNTALRFRDAPRNHCVACERARAAVNKCLRNGTPTPGIDVVADQKFMELKAQHEDQQAA